MRPIILLLPLACTLSAACQLPRPVIANDYTKLCVTSSAEPPANALLFVTLRLPDCRRPPAILMSAYRGTGPWYGAVDDQLRITFYDEKIWHSAAAARLRASTSHPPIVFIHGYNNDNRTALARALAIREVVGNDRPVIALTWPSYNRTSKYFWDEANAEWAMGTARNLIGKLGSPSSPKIHRYRAQHGSCVGLDSVKSFQGRDLNGPMPVERLIMASPDVDLGARCGRSWQAPAASAPRSPFMHPVRIRPSLLRGERMAMPAPGTSATGFPRPSLPMTSLRDSLTST